MGACCSAQETNQGEYYDTTPAVALPKSEQQRHEQEDDYLGNVATNSNEKGKKTKFKNPKYDPYNNTRVQDKHDYSVQKFFQNSIKPNNQEAYQQAMDIHKQFQQNIDQHDITTQIHLQNVKRNYLIVRQQLMQSGQKFVDPNFPHINKSISKYKNSLQNADRYNWLKSDICIDVNQGQELQVFQGGIEPGDIKQGALGDCYFLCSLSALAERPGLIKRLFTTKEIQDNGLYCVWLCINGEWQEVLIDDYFPCYQNRPAFSRAQGDELWVLLLEKAYAKVFGSYDKIQAGLTGEAIRDLTGSPSKWIPTSKGVDAVWAFIDEHDNQGHIMTAGSQQEAQVMQKLDGRQEQDMGQGIVSGHAYSILDHRVIYNPQEVRLVQLRNPWGSHEWTGDWSDKSPLWTHQLKQQLGVQDKDDGLFWMDVRDLCKQFSDITTNMLVENGEQGRYVYNSLKIKLPKNNQTQRVLVKIVSPEDNEGYIQISQKDSRFYSNEPITYEYSDIKLLVSKDDFTKYIGDIQMADRDIFVNNTFERGVYYAYIEVDWSQNSQDADFITISSYTKSTIVFQGHEILQPNDCEILDKILLSKPPQNPEKVQQIQGYNIKRYINNAGGYLTFNYINLTDNITINESVQLKNRKFLDIQYPYKNSDNFQLTIKPNETKIVKYKISKEGNGSYGYSVGFQSEVVMGDEDLIQQIKKNPKSVNQRKLNGQLLPIWCYSYFHSKGLALYWENQSDNTYTEKLILNLTNLKFENPSQDKGYDPQNPQLDFTEINLGPSQSKLVKLVVIDPQQGVAYGSQCSFSVQ